MQNASHVVLAFVVNAAWQVPLVALAAAAGAPLLRSAAARHRLLLGALAASLLLPIAGSLGASLWPFPAFARPHAAAASATAASWPILPVAPPAPLYPPARMAVAVAGAYFVVLGVGVARRGRAWRRAAALRRSAVPVPLPDAARTEAERARGSLGLGAVSVLLSPAVDSPVTLGVRRPVILLPLDRAASWPRPELAAALAHEMAHVRRHDFAWNVAAELAALPIAFHPATGWMMRRIRQARELACDALVADLVIEPVAYARALARLARSLAPAPMYALGVADAGILEERVMSLVTGRSRRRAGMLASVAAAGLLAAASGLAASYAVAGKPAGGNGAIVGTWIGRVAQWGDLPSVDLYLSEKGGKLSGRATFYLIHVGADGRREVGGTDLVDLIEPSFDGRRLAFKIKDRTGKIHSIELRLTGEGQADYVEVGSGEGDEGHKPDLLVKMKRK